MALRGRTNPTDVKTTKADASQACGFSEVHLDLSSIHDGSKDAMIANLESVVVQEYRGYQALVERTIDVFGDELTASRWLSMPNVDFQNRTPLEVAEEVSYDPSATSDIFEPVFIRIEHGVDW